MKLLGKIFLVLFGALVGILTVRGFFLSPLEELGWLDFWNQIEGGSLVAVKTVYKSRAFSKAFVGIVLGGAAGYLFGLVVDRLKFKSQRKKKKNLKTRP
jgi:hypothetical protein